MLGSLELLTKRPEGEGGDLAPAVPAPLVVPEAPADELAGRGSGDRSKSDSGEEA